MDALYNLATNIVNYLRDFVSTDILDMIQDFFDKIFNK